MMTSLFGRFPNYDVEKTVVNIRRLKDRYYPATFGYLYRLYDLDMEPDIDPSMTGVDYLAKRLSFDAEIIRQLRDKNEKECLSNKGNIINKEMRYLKENDEVVSVRLLNKFGNIKNIEMENIEKYVNSILSNDIDHDRVAIPKYMEYTRHEEEGKKRKLVSLESFDRIVTTSLALRLCQELKHPWQSYSYRVSYMEADNLFYPWYSSWGRYIDQIRLYLDLPFMSRNYVSYLDLKHCYENIDILLIYNSFKSSVSLKGCRAFEYLCAYNDRLMKALNDGNRIGMPQGPAYARILTEIYLDKIIGEMLAVGEKEIPPDCRNVYRLFRYVDDIVVFADDEAAAKELYKVLSDGFWRRGLPINIEKSKYCGQISQLSLEDRNKLLHKENFSYLLTDKDLSKAVFDNERKSQLMKYFRKNPFKMDLMGYVFSVYTFEEAKEFYFDKYGGKIMSSIEGRGKYFRQFYKYLLSHSAHIQRAAKEGWFGAIRIDSINFSNFINTFYFMLQDNRIADSDARLIILHYINDEFNMEQASAEDKFTIEAIKKKVNTE